MSQKPRTLEIRRALLVSAAARQRLSLAQSVAPWRAPLAIVDRGLELVRVVQQHPHWWLGGLLLFAMLRPRWLLPWLQRGWVGWQLSAPLRATLARPDAAHGP
ncbi:MAG: YqjK-like family protein [Lysobacterales bacterium]